MDSHAALYELGKKRLAQLREMKPLRDESFQQKLESHGISRRDFMIWSATITSLLALPMPFNTMVAEAAELADRVPLIWLSMAECTGCSESFVRTTTPDISTILFEHVSLEYQEVLMAAAGMQAEENLDNAIKNYKGKYLLAVEGAIPTANNGTFLTIGNKAETGVDLIKRVTKDAAAIMCVGTCSSFGGVQAASPNPTGAKGVGAVVDLPVINVAGCPPNPANITGTLMYYIMFGRLPALDIFNRPKWAYGARVHDNCERRGHFDAG
ncbi:hydrogenase, partial [Photobacterium damselae subsp. damselae]